MKLRVHLLVLFALLFGLAACGSDDGAETASASGFGLRLGLGFRLGVGLAQRRVRGL
jgi:hypothetical protein